MTVAALGGEIDAPCLLGGEACDGNCKIAVKVPEGLADGQDRPPQGPGHAVPAQPPARRPGGRTVRRNPDPPFRAAKELLKELADLCGETQNPKSANFVGKAKRFWDEVTGS
jgi:molecular chaperone DnaJ